MRKDSAKNLLKTVEKIKTLAKDYNNKEINFELNNIEAFLRGYLGLPMHPREESSPEKK